MIDEDGAGTDGGQTEGQQAENVHQSRDGEKGGSGSEPGKPGLQFDAKSKSPLGEAIGETYRRGKQNLRVSGDGAVITDSAVRDIIIHSTETRATGWARVREAPGPVRREDLSYVRAWYTPVAGYDHLRVLLAERHIIVLCGVEGTGRTVTALRLLDEVCKGNVSRAEQVENPGPDVDSFDEGAGYLVELAASGVAVLTQAWFDRASAALSGKPAWCVIVAGPDFVADGSVAGYVAVCELPDAWCVLERHLESAARDLGPDVVPAFLETPVPPPRAAAPPRPDDIPSLLETARCPEIAKVLGPAPRPAEMAKLATLLIAYRRAAVTFEKLQSECSGFVDLTVAEWFRGARAPARGEAGEQVLRLAAFRIALAVFDYCPHNVVDELGERLAERIVRERMPHRTPVRSAFAGEHRIWLEASRARLVDGYAEIGTARVPADHAEFVDSRMPVAVLRHVWQYHHTARKPLVAWLRELVDDGRPYVRVRAAQAAGLLCSLDFPYAYDALVRDWSASEELRHRWAAAFALDQAASNPPVQAFVRQLMTAWWNGEDESRKWTICAALGTDLGLGDIERSLDILVDLGTWRQDAEDSGDDTDDDDSGEARDRWPFIDIASYSVARLLALGAVDAVISRLHRWLVDRRRDVRDVALYSILWATRMTVRDLWDMELFASGTGRRRWRMLEDRRRWPLLLALQDEDHTLADPVADLVWQALETARSRNWAAAELTRWLRAGERDGTCLPALATFLLRLADTPSSTRRLRLLLQRSRRRWHRPLRADVADYLDRALLAAQGSVIAS